MPNLCRDERNQIVQFLLGCCSNGKPQRGKIGEAAATWNTTTRTVSRLWAAAKKQREQGQAILSVARHQTRQKVIVHKPDFTKIMNMPLSSRGTYRTMSIELKVSKSTLARWKKLGFLRAHTSAIKPSLTAENKLIRIRFSLESLELDRILMKLRFNNMHSIVHIDEKWFYITKGSHRYYLTPDEEEPYRACKSKKFIGKIMFMCAVTRPLLNEDDSVHFDGKIGIFPFTKEAEALRKSKYRDKGTKYLKAVDSITREVIKDCLINKVVPRIKAKWPQASSKNICIQQDNAKPHIVDSDPEFRACASADGFNITLVQQPPNSPDCNVNDLGFFRAIQSLQQERVCKSVDDLVQAVVESFYQLQPVTLNKVFLSLQGCLTEILKVRGHNNYKIPHMGKDAMIRAGTLPGNLEVPFELARDCIEYLIEVGQINGIETLVHKLGLQQITGN